MANIKISELNELTKSNKAYNDYLPIVDTSTNETKKISVENLTANNVYLLAVVKLNGQVPTPVAGAKYYNEVQNKIYYAPDDEHWYEYGTPVEGIFYVVLGEKGNYAYDSENETLVSVGGGSGSEIVVGDESEATEDTKLIIEDDDLDYEGSEIVDEYSVARDKGYSAKYSNEAFGGTILWTNDSPNGEFANQTIPLDLSNFDSIAIIYIIETGASWGRMIKNTGIMPIQSTRPICMEGTIVENTSSSTFAFRSATVSSTGITFGTGYNNVSNSGATERLYACVPWYIIGYKSRLFN